MTAESDQLASGFLALHQRGAGFVLPNVWDAGSARILEQVGFAALATTSAGIAFSKGLPDGELSRGEALEALASIVGSVSCPVTADLESGYGDNPAAVAATITSARATGVVGANLEDAAAGSGLLDLENATERILAARDAAPAGTFVLNARTDPYMVGHPDPFAETVRRAERYVAAGADCIFVPGVGDPDAIRRLAAEIPAPLNIVAGLVPPLLDAAALRTLGVARISIGGSLTRAVLTLVERAGTEMLQNGTFDFTAGAISYGDLQQRFGQH
ncbi:MAG: isocitrate lyase/phosphoenolpyruvate mutase family protein [Propionibacteriales bacterium]|nr:isocitrate lyase/phosphoenolpyruvate mutase family protein [Propionibacteriales bacterium]